MFGERETDGTIKEGGILRKEGKRKNYKKLNFIVTVSNRSNLFSLTLF